MAQIIDMATQYGRYGYRRVTELLRRAGWRVNHKRVERIWRREGLKVWHSGKTRAEETAGILAPALSATCVLNNRRAIFERSRSDRGDGRVLSQQSIGRE